MQSNSFFYNLFDGITNRIRRVFSPQQKKANINWFSEKYLKHAPAGVTRTYNINNGKVYYSNPSEFLHTLREIFVHEIYKASYPAGSYIIDCGANIGLSSIYFKQQCPDAEIIAFEPDSKNYELLTKNIASLNLANITPRKEAIWIEDTEIDFSDDGTMGSKIELNSEKKSHPVKAVRLRDFLHKKVNFLKLDIEGAEYRVLRDIAPELQKVENLFLEYHGKFNQVNELTEIFVLLQHAGFSYYIKEAASIYESPFMASKVTIRPPYDVQLNIFCFRQS